MGRGLPSLWWGPSIPPRGPVLSAPSQASLHAPPGAQPSGLAACVGRPDFSYVLPTYGFGGQVWVEWALAHVFIRSGGLGLGFPGGCPEPQLGLRDSVCWGRDGALPPRTRSFSPCCDDPTVLAQLHARLPVSWHRLEAPAPNAHTHCVLCGMARPRLLVPSRFPAVSPALSFILPKPFLPCLHGVTRGLLCHAVSLVLVPGVSVLSPAQTQAHCGS